VINIAEELAGYDRGRAHDRIRGIFDITARVLATAEAEGLSTEDAAERLAEERIAALGAVARIRTHR
jgi:hypothetical protein